MANYEILDAKGKAINTIVAEQVFVETHYPGRHKLLKEVIVTSEPLAQPIDPIKDLALKVESLKVILLSIQAKIVG